MYNVEIVSNIFLFVDPATIHQGQDTSHSIESMLGLLDSYGERFFRCS